MIPYKRIVTILSQLRRAEYEVVVAGIAHRRRNDGLQRRICSKTSVCQRPLRRTLVVNVLIVVVRRIERFLEPR